MLNADSLNNFPLNEDPNSAFAVALTLSATNTTLVSSGISVSVLNPMSGITSPRLKNGTQVRTYQKAGT